MNNEFGRLICLDHVEQQKKMTIIDDLVKEIDSAEPNSMKAELMDPKGDLFLVRQNTSALPEGYVIARNYDRLEHSREIVPRLCRYMQEALIYKEILREVINVVSQDKQTESIVLRIEESLEPLVRCAESIGFMKEGIYISNQFLQGEFSFYSVYRYKLS